MNNMTGLSQETLSYIEGILRQALKNKSCYSVSIFGSRVKNKFRQYSDLDLWLESSPSMTPSEISNLRIQFEESQLAIKVDIVTLESCLPEYIEQIQSEKKLWFDS